MNDLMIKRAIWDKQIVIRKDDTISRQLAIEAIKRAIWDKQTAKDAIDAVCNISSAQPERKKGKWIWKGSINEGFWTCSECGQKFYQGYGNENFCPNCGKRMMKGEENEQI